MNPARDVEEVYNYSYMGDGFGSSLHVSGGCLVEAV
jgi:hypothetical protein